MAEQQTPKIGEDVTALMGAAEAEPVMPSQHPHAKVGKWVTENAPTIGAGLAAALTSGASIPAQMLAAGGGAFLGARARGDSRERAAQEGVLQGGLQGAGGLVMKAGRAIGRGLMKGTVPKNIAKEYDQVNIPQEMLNRGVFPGSARSARRVSRLSGAANDRTRAVARQMPDVSRREVTAAFREPFDEAAAAKMPDTARAIASHARGVGRELRGGISAEGALTRKRILQRQGQAALNNPQTGAFMPQLKDAERATITGLLRREPAMASALNESQTLMAIDDVMKDAALSNPVTRARIGGLTAASMSPLGLGATAHLVNQGSKAFNPQVIRLLDLILREGSHP